MLLTVDTSAVLAVAIGEPTRPRLITATTGADLVAPASLPAEIGNALSAMFKRKRIDAADAERVLEAYRKIPIRLVDLDLSQAVALSDRFGIYAYDAYVISCALAEGTALLSLDRGQRDAAEKAGVSLHPF